LANKSVVLYQSIKIGREWILRAVDEDSSHFSDGPFYISWYDDKKKQMDPVGRDSAHALRMANLKRAAACVHRSGRRSQEHQPRSESRARVSSRGNQEQQPGSEPGRNLNGR
jgi:hypothetical protein